MFGVVVCAFILRARLFPHYCRVANLHSGVMGNCSIKESDCLWVYLTLFCTRINGMITRTLDGTHLMSCTSTFCASDDNSQSETPFRLVVYRLGWPSLHSSM